MKQKIEKVNGIRAALLKRGETELIDPYKLMAFSDACLDACIEEMRNAKKPKRPYAFFLSRAFAWCKYNNTEADWVLADTLREQKLPEFESERPAGFKKQTATEGRRPEPETQKREDRVSPYSVEVQRTMAEEAAKAEARKPKIENLAEDIAGLEAQCVELEKKAATSSLHVELLAYTRKHLAAKREQLNPGSTETNDLGRGRGVGQNERQNVTSGPPDLSKIDYNNQFVRICIYKLTKRLEQIEFDGEEGRRIRKELHERWGIYLPLVNKPATWQPGDPL